MALALDKPLQATVGRNYPRAPQPVGLELPLKDHQLAMLQRCIDIEKVSLMSPYKMGFMADEVAAGKCFSKGTPILMHSGDVKKVEEVTVGDHLMGDDSRPREVLALGQGQDDMYEIRPKDGGMSFTVNSDHILCLKPSDHGQVLVDSEGVKSLRKYEPDGSYADEVLEDRVHELSARAQIEDVVCCLTVKQLLALDDEKLSKFQGYRRPLDLPDDGVDLDPYLVGLWLGRGRGTGDLDALVYSTGLRSDSHIPRQFKINGRRQRLQLLAGLIDSCGCRQGNTYVLSRLRSTLYDDTAFLARSLGYRVACESLLKVSGSLLHQIPVRLKPNTIAAQPAGPEDGLQFEFDIVSKGHDQYFGFEINGNKRFMLADTTVTHNTAVSLALPLIEKTAYRKAFLNIIVVPQNICMQWMTEIAKFTGKAFKTLLLIDYMAIADLTFSPSDIAQYDIVLTTPMYFTTLADFCDRANIKPRRVIIDEADTIANMVSKKIPGVMTWFVSATIDRLPESRTGMVQVGKEVKAFEDGQGPVNKGSAIEERTNKRGTLRAEETGTYEIPSRLLRSGERICRCDASWVSENFSIPAPVKEKVVVSNVIMDVLAALTYARLLRPQQLESANARDFRNLRMGDDDEFRILPALLKKYQDRKEDAEVTLAELRNTMHMEQRVSDSQAEIKRCSEYIALLRNQAAANLLCQGTFEQLALPDRGKEPVTSCLMCPECQAGYCHVWVEQNPKRPCLRCGSKKELEERNPGDPALAENKVTKLVDLINSYRDKHEKPRVMVFAKYTQAFSEIHRKLADTGLVVMEADAGTPKAAEKMLTDFKSGAIDVLLAEASLFCSGMNLPEVTDVCFLHVVHEYSQKQIAGRGQRPGRKAPLRIWTFLHDNETSAYNG